MRPSDLHLDLDTFAGPFDLLCTVLLRRELTLADVPLAEVVVAYVQRLAMQEDVSPDTASEFLLLVAALCEIKSRELLAIEQPLDIAEPAAPEAYDEMLERLVRYTTFRNAAAWLGRRGQRQRYWRVASRPVIRRQKTYDGPVLDPAPLRAAIELLLAQPGVDVRHLVGKHISVAQMTARMLQIMRARRSFRFEEEVEGLSRLDQAVAFVAVLELCKRGEATVNQPEPFGTITVSAIEQGRAAGGGPAGGTSGEHEGEVAHDAAGETEFQIA